MGIGMGYALLHPVPEAVLDHSAASDHVKWLGNPAASREVLAAAPSHASKATDSHLGHEAMLDHVSLQRVIKREIVQQAQHSREQNLIAGVHQAGQGGHCLLMWLWT